MVRAVWTLTLAGALATPVLTASHEKAPGSPAAAFRVDATAGRAASSPEAAGDEKPSIVLRASPNMAFSPARIVATADVRGGPDDHEELYCPTVEWDWGDGTRSESSVDCEPYEPGRSEIKRRYVSDHRYTYAGRYRVTLRLRRGNKVVLSAGTNVVVRPGAQEFGVGQS